MRNEFLLFLAAVVLTSCEDVIDLDLNTADPQLVIEGHVTNYGVEVELTLTADYYYRVGYRMTIDDPIGQITINNSSHHLLNEYSERSYSSYLYNYDVPVKPNAMYEITLNVNGKTYYATSITKTAMTIDSLGYKFLKSSFNESKKYLELHVFFKDNPDERNFAKFDIYKNGSRVDGIFLYDDRLTNGNEIDYFYFNFGDEEFQREDEISVKLISIDEHVHTYFKTLTNALVNSNDGPFATQAPSNPISNWSNGALGFFSAEQSRSKDIILK